MNRSAIIRPAQVHKLYLTAASQIAEAISRGGWNPGDKMPSERELAVMLNVSRATLRQALAALEAIGVIRVKAGVGTFVQDDALEVISEELVSELVTEGDPLMLVEARLCLEPSLAYLAAKNRVKEDLAQLECVLSMMDRFQEGQLSATEFIHTDIQYHLVIATATQNPVLVRMFDQLVDQMHHQIWVKAAQPVIERRAAYYQQDHVLICEAIRGKQASEAHQLMEEHLRAIQKNLQSFSAITEE